MNKLYLIGVILLFASITSFSCMSIEGVAKSSVDKKKEVVPSPSSQKPQNMAKNKDDVDYRIIATSAYSNMPYAQGIYIARSIEDAIAISEGNGMRDGLFSDIDFKNEAIIFIFAGQFNTGGYTISVDSIKRQGKKKIIAKFSVLSPPMGAIVTQAITTPSMIVAIKVQKGEMISASFTE